LVLVAHRGVAVQILFSVQSLLLVAVLVVEPLVVLAEAHPIVVVLLGLVVLVQQIRVSLVVHHRTLEMTVDWVVAVVVRVR
jgi:hypothetical protein